MSEVASLLSVPFYDLGPSHAPLRARLRQELDALIDANCYTNGPHVAAFEQAWAAYCGTEHCVGVASGLDALRLALLACSIEPGDEVVVPAHTFAATFEAVSQVGAVPVPADISLVDYNLDPAAAAGAITPRTRFIMPVHLYGHMCDVQALRVLGENAGAELIEDACQAHGATRDGLRAGTAGRAAAFSFYPAKNLGAFGDAGALVTDDLELADDVRALREHGQRAKYVHDLEGYTARLDTIQALVLSQKLVLLDEWNEKRRWIASAYESSLSGVGDLVLPTRASGSNPVWHLYVVRTKDPDALARFLSARGVGTGRHYPEPPHLSRAYSSLGYRAGDFPNSETAAAKVLSLPLFPGMSEAQIAAVVDSISRFFDGG